MPRASKNVPLPSRNPLAEAFIYAGAVGILAYMIGILVFVLIANMFNDTSSATVGPFSLIVAIIGGSFVAQAVMLMRQWQRVDHYRERLIALGTMLLLPLLILVRMVGGNITAVSWQQNGAHSLDHPIYGVFTSLTSNTLLEIAAIITVVGSVWLWVLLFKKDKLFWVLEGNPRTKEYKQRRSKLARNKKIGSYLLVAPVVLFGLFIYTSFSAGFHGGNVALYGVAGAMRSLVLYLSIPSIIAGIIVLARNK